MFQDKTKTETKIRGRKPNRIVSFPHDCKRCDLALPFFQVRTIMCQPCLWREAWRLQSEAGSGSEERWGWFSTKGSG